MERDDLMRVRDYFKVILLDKNFGKQTPPKDDQRFDPFSNIYEDYQI